MRWFSLCALILACGDSGGGVNHPDGPPPDAPSFDGPIPDARPLDLPPISPYPNCPTCQHARYVVDHIVVPQSNAQAMMLGCDINADGVIDNQMGKVLGALYSASNTVDPQTAMNAKFQDGTLIMLYEVAYSPSLTMTQMAGLRAFVGSHDSSDGLTAPAFYMGQGRFTVTSENGTGMGGSIQNGAGTFGPNDAILQLTLVQTGPPVTMPLERAYLTGTFSATTIQNGKLCGAIDAQVVRTTFLPQIADLLSAQVKAGGSTADTIKSLFDTDHSCDSDSSCTPSAAGPCHCITETEVENNSIIKSLLSPDLNLDPYETNPFVTDPSDPTYPNDALSVGFGLSANAAMFAVP